MPETDYAQLCMFCGRGIVFDTNTIRWILCKGKDIRAAENRIICEPNPIDRIHIPKPRDAQSYVIGRVEGYLHT